MLNNAHTTQNAHYCSAGLRLLVLLHLFLSSSYSSSPSTSSSSSCSSSSTSPSIYCCPDRTLKWRPQRDWQNVALTQPILQISTGPSELQGWSCTPPLPAPHSLSRACPLHQLPSPDPEEDRRQEGACMYRPLAECPSLCKLLFASLTRSRFCPTGDTTGPFGE